MTAGSRGAEDPVFGDVALALAPRSCVDAIEARSIDRLRVGVVANALSANDRTQLERVHAGKIECDARSRATRDAKLEPTTSAAADRAPRELLSCSRKELAAIEPRVPAIAAILAAHDNALRDVTSVRIMGVVNATPDSFSDGGRFADSERAVEHGLRLAAEGAEVIDVGGESTRPGAAPVDADVERARVVPIIAALAKRTRVAISVDTTKASVAEAALDAGASIVNDVSAGRLDARMLDAVASRGAGFVAMHMQGTPRAMQLDPRYDDVVTEVAEFLRGRVRACLDAGIERSKIWIDPGIGFGKRLEHNIELIVHLRELRSLGLPICLGVSRKSFIAAIEKRSGAPMGADADARVGGTAAAIAVGVVNGAEILRVHDVHTMLQAARIALALSRRIRAAEPS